jgi:SAM-dependent methyltransferase
MTPQDLSFNEINQDFYNSIGPDFDETRFTYWPGWLKIASLVDLKKINKVLDLGCGNARFYKFLEENGFVGEYIGIDYTKSLLDSATAKYGNKIKLIQADIILQNWSDLLNSKVLQTQSLAGAELEIEEAQKFDLVVSFGVMHHLPSEQIRVSFLSQINSFLNTQGRAVVATWQFLDNERLRKKIVDLNFFATQTFLQKYNLKISDFGSGDYLLDWKRGQTAYRFSHYYEDQELQNLLQKTPQKTKVKDFFYADGKDSASNKYFLISS